MRRDRLTTNGVPKGLWRKQCEGTSRTTGKRCGNPAVPGLFVCRFHGGATKNAQAAGRRRIAELSGTALDALLKLLDHEDPEVVLKAADQIFERSGCTILDVYEAEARRAEARLKKSARGSRRAQRIAS